MKISQIERQIKLNQLWRRYLKVCENKQHAINAMRKVTGKMHSADFTEQDIANLCEDLSWREDEASGVNQALFDYYHGDWGDRD